VTWTSSCDSQLSLSARVAAELYVAAATTTAPTIRQIHVISCREDVGPGVHLISCRLDYRNSLFYSISDLLMTRLQCVQNAVRLVSLRSANSKTCSWDKTG